MNWSDHYTFLTCTLSVLQLVTIVVYTVAKLFLSHPPASIHTNRDRHVVILLAYTFTDVGVGGGPPPPCLSHLQTMTPSPYTLTHILSLQLLHIYICMNWSTCENTTIFCLSHIHCNNTQRADQLPVYLSLCLSYGTSGLIRPSIWKLWSFR